MLIDLENQVGVCIDILHRNRDEIVQAFTGKVKILKRQEVRIKDVETNLVFIRIPGTEIEFKWL